MKKLLGLGYMVALVFTIACGSTDAGITTSVKTKLAADDAVKAYQVDVDTRDHVVTLSGAVDTELARTRAVALARQADGVRDVVDNITVHDGVATSGRDLSDEAERVEDKTKSAAKETGDAVTDSAKKVGNAAKKGAEAVADGAKKAGHEVKDAVTDNDPDTDKDGK